MITGMMESVHNLARRRLSVCPLAEKYMDNLASLREYRDVVGRHRAYLREWIDKSGDEDAKKYAF